MKIHTHKMSVDTGLLMKNSGMGQERASEVRKSASSFELRLLNENSEHTSQQNQQMNINVSADYIV